MKPKKGFNLKSNDVMVVPMPIRKIINALKWERFCDARSLPDDELVQELYASFTTQEATEVIVRQKKVPFTSKFIDGLFNLLDVEEDEYYPMMNNINWDFLQQVLNVPGSQWIIKKYESHSCRREYLKLVAKSTNKIETEADSVTNTEEEESDKEPNSPKPVEGSTNPVFRAELEEEPVKLSVELEFTTPILISASASKRLEFSILMDMCKFMHNQQQTY
ncbi:hypothetical protein J1N35_040845 [Gossypium stocksii]|uniref:Uncharacterized protein n=1 Tax=Gossypium stocksii TaxID=47602 RepID=A0A9D3ZIR1_9ROSI|nr:hypothetical protein J1N35_040845 [Gossypium stocksii]